MVKVKNKCTNQIQHPKAEGQETKGYPPTLC